MKYHFITHFTIIFFISASAAENIGTRYQIQKGDTLSDLAFELLNGKIYGNHGSLKRLIGANTHISDPNLIYPGQYIRLPQDLIKIKKTLTYTKEKPRIIRSIQEQPIYLEIETSDLTNVKDQAPIQMKAFRSNSSFGFYPKFGYARLESLHTGKASATSRLGLGAKIDWTQHWTNTFESQVYVSKVNYTFETAENSALATNTGSISEFGLGVAQSFTRKFIGLLLLGYRTSPFLRASTQNLGSIENVPTGVIKLVPIYKPLIIQDFRISLTTPFEYELSGRGANIQTRGGFGHGVGIEVAQKVSWGKVNAGITYRSFENRFNTAKTTTKEIRMYFGFRFKVNSRNNG
jgi:LysM repeat protein